MKMLKFFFILAAKLAALGFVGFMALLQVPELRYDLGGREPLVIGSAEELAGLRFRRPAFVAVRGRADFSNAFTYKRYGLTFTYFTLKPYGLEIIARTNDRVTDEWTQIEMFLGKIRPFAEQPFSYRIAEIFQEQKGERIPAGAYFLALDDVPAVSGWQVGALVFSVLLWLLLCYFFFLYRGSLFTGNRPPSKAAGP